MTLIITTGIKIVIATILTIKITAIIIYVIVSSNIRNNSNSSINDYNNSKNTKTTTIITIVIPTASIITINSNEVIRTKLRHFLQILKKFALLRAT